MAPDPLNDADARLEALVRPADWRNPRPADRYHLVVIGAGTAGLVAAAGAAALGARVALVERARMGGDCLNHGCVPSKALLASARAAAARRAASPAFHPGSQPSPGNLLDGSAPTRDLPTRDLPTGDLPAGDVPAGAFPASDFGAVMRRMRELRSRLAPNDSAQRFRELGVDLFFGTARFLDRQTVGVDDTRLRFRRAVIATGARAALPAIPGLAAAEPLTNESLFDLRQLPRRLAVVGGGPIGCEMAQAFARLGASVVVIECAASVLPREDRDAGAVVERALRRDGVRFRLSATMDRVAQSASSLTSGFDADRRAPASTMNTNSVATAAATAAAATASNSPAKDGWTLFGRGPEGAWEETVDRILVATGRSPNVEGLELAAAGVELGPHGVRVDDFLRTANRRVYAAGDVCSPYRFTHAADFMARAVVRNALFFGRARVSKLIIPWCTYTDPEVAHVGLSEQQAQTAGMAVDVLVQPLAEVDRAILETAPFAYAESVRPAASDGPEGFVKVLLRRGTDRIVGATIVAPHAGEMLGELTLAMRKRLGIGELGNTIHPYPTVADAIRKLGDQYQRRRLTPGVRALFQRWFAWWR